MPEELELNVVVAGSAVIQVGSDLYPSSAGDGLWIAPRQPRATRACSPDLAMWALMFRPRLVEELGTTQSLKLHGPAERCTLTQDSLAEFSANAYFLLRNQKRVEQFNLGLATTLLDTWRNARGPAGAAPPQHLAVATAVHTLQNRWDRFALPGLAKRVGLSPYQLSRLFHRQVGVPISFYAAHLAVQRFARLSVQDPSKNTLQCALSAGFGSYAQFYRSFSLVVGLGPREHRKLFDDGILPPARYIAPELPGANPVRR